MVSVIFWTIVLYLLYRFVFGFLIPVISATRQMKMKMRNMHEQMNKQQGFNPQGDTTGTTNAKSTSTPPKGDYIDFEEVK